jgi:ATP-dependent Zn protease
MNDWVNLAVSWLPFLLLIGVWLYLSRKQGMQARGSSGASMIELYEQQVAETRRMNGYLERIAAAMEKREGGGISR